MKSYSSVAALVSFVSSVAAHGYITSPTPRMPGNALKAACGDQVFNQQSSDHFGNVQGTIQNLQGAHPDCRPWQCKGIPFADAKEVFSYTAGQVIPMKVDIRAPHSGSANVSVVKVSTDKIIGKPLLSWDQYGLTSEPLSKHPEWTSFSVTMPDVSSDCAKAGDCVIQWWWDAPTINQSYESCIDFTMGGSGGGGNSKGTTNAAPATQPSASAPSTPTKPTGMSSPTTTASDAKPASGSSSGSGVGAAQEKTFTVDSLIKYIREKAGSGAANKARNVVERAHARAFAA